MHRHYAAPALHAGSAKAAGNVWSATTARPTAWAGPRTPEQQRTQRGSLPRTRLSCAPGVRRRRARLGGECQRRQRHAEDAVQHPSGRSRTLRTRGTAPGPTCACTLVRRMRFPTDIRNTAPRCFLRLLLSHCRTPLDDSGGDCRSLMSLQWSSVPRSRTSFRILCTLLVTFRYRISACLAGGVDSEGCNTARRASVARRAAGGGH
jgi:hypothetical protein